MFLPFLDAKNDKSTIQLRFGGLDLREKPSGGSLSESENMSADAYPALSPRKPREKVVSETGITMGVMPEYTGTPLTAFTGIKDRGFYYQGNRIGNTQLAPGEKSIADFGGKLCIFPDKLFYNYLPDPTTGKVSETLESMEKTLTLSGVTFYASYNELTGVYRAYLQKNGGGFERFSPGDSVLISGCRQAQNNTVNIQGRKDAASEDAIVSAVVDSADASHLHLLLYTKTGKRALFTSTTETGSITVKVSIPDMNHVCVHNNRLWGTAENGEYLYASKLGDCCNFHSFQGLADDSWYSAIGTAGSFSGIVSYRSAVVAFKQTCIHHVYGDGPQNYSIPKQTAGGCIDGRSITELQGVLYYLSDAGFRAYSGGEPYGVSPQLPVTYCAAVSGTDGIRYYAAAQRLSGERDLLVYDPEKNLWHREDDTPFLSLLHYGNRLYGVCEDGIWCFGQGDERVSWSFTTQPITYDSFLHQGFRALRLLLDTEKDTRVSVSVSSDGAPFVPCAELSSAETLKSHRIPVRFQKCDSFRIRIQGQGRAVLHALELSVYQGGKTYAI